MTKNKYHVIGLMSGTSLDGLDIAYCSFHYKNGKWVFEIKDSITINYSEKYEEELRNSMNFTTKNLNILDKNLGEFWGKEINKFIINSNLEVDFICSHGHTIFHQPEKGITLQIGNAYQIANECNLDVISDFRTLDVKLGGQGAPLVPIGDKMLFSDYKYCLNLGGISNVSFDDNRNERRAFDISPCNLILNHYANLLNQEFDNNGDIGKGGSINSTLLSKLNAINYYQRSTPKSLGKEDIVNIFIPTIESFDITIEDKMRTFYEHISIQITSILNDDSTLVTGGGAYNTFLIELIKEKSNSKIIIPSDDLISFKEAMIFAFLGVLKIRNENNILKSYTGASKNSSSGIITRCKLKRIYN